ncbi:MAG: hypothetical protein U1F70_05345 [Candidatus Competibacteraceae bacterium]
MKARELDLKAQRRWHPAPFPFRDGIDLAAERGITAVIEPGALHARRSDRRRRLGTT